MGCDQSKGNKPPLSPARVDRVINIEPQQIIIDSSGKQLSRKEASSKKSYQGVQAQKIDMDPSQLQDILQEYSECEDRIRSLEKDDPLTLYYIKKSHLQSLDEAIQATQEKIDSFRKAVQNGETDAANKEQSLKKVVVAYGTKGVASTKAEQEFLTSANRLEIATTELEMLHQDKALVESDVSEFKAICTKLAEYYDRQDTISKNLSPNVTNSEEALLYKELAEAEASKIKISETFHRWKEGRLQTIDACRQFAYALKKWREIDDDTPANLYDNTEEVRDDLVTALQSINNARFYIKSELPYCSKAEMSVLEKALSYIFIDMNSSERRLHADSCYSAFHNRAVALFAWTDMTLKTIIVPDVRTACEELTETSGKLRDARFQTITQQFPDVTWKRNEEELEDPEAGMIALSDLDSVRILAQLDTTQLSNPPSRSEIYGKFAGSTDYKSMLKNSTSNGALKSTFDKNVENIIMQRKSSLKQDLVQVDIVGIV